MIEETEYSWPLEPITIKLRPITVFSTADMKSAYKQMPPDKFSQRLTNFDIAGQHYCVKKLNCPTSIDPLAFLSAMSSIFKPLIRKNKVITYLDHVFVNDETLLKMPKNYHQFRKRKS